MKLPVLFQCVPLATKLTRSACGQRHASANTKERGRVFSETCATCPIGAAHARGEEPTRWPDGSPIALAAISGAPPPAVRLSTAPITKEPVMPPPTPITFNGKTQSASDWGRELGFTPPAILNRIKRAKARGLDEKAAIQEALTKPRDSTQPRGRTVRDAKGAPVAGATIHRAPSEKAIRAPLTRAKISKLAKPIAAEPAARIAASPEQALAAFGYRIVESIDTPRGTALIVEAP